MRILIKLICVIIFLNGCTSSKTYLKRGDYERAVIRSVQKLRKNRNKEKEIYVLKDAYKKANDEDNDRINYLKKEGSPSMWTEIFNLYSELASRQSMVKSVTPLKLKGKPVQFNMVDYDQEIINAKQKAAEYFYARGTNLLQNKDRGSAREAYNEFTKVKSYYTDYKDIDTKLKESHSRGVSYVLFRIANKSSVIIPSDFQEDLLKVSMNDVNTMWVTYHTKAASELNYDYNLAFNIKTIVVSPEGLKEVHHAETKEVQDGWQYQLDSKGNVMKDSLGNDIKLPKYKTISCNVVEVIKNKKAMISGTLDFVDNTTGQLIKTDPVTAETFFENISAAAFGDVNALKPETKSRLSAPNLPFPSDQAMIRQTSSTLKEIIKDIIYSNRGLLR